ncbi:hypothetical protein C1H46_024627 [Malus baccata]|uniref:Uncharacterized protein n=1 Tax=Malus baccata TaxID=106549 RepID=A0A540LTF6_MALBA|nr:hypothetical protein C1H46_024627 [Malus baccata]
MVQTHPHSSSRRVLASKVPNEHSQTLDKFAVLLWPKLSATSKEYTPTIRWRTEKKFCETSKCALSDT